MKAFNDLGEVRRGAQPDHITTEEEDDDDDDAENKKAAVSIVEHHCDYGQQSSEEAEVDENSGGCEPPEVEHSNEPPELETANNPIEVEKDNITDSGRDATKGDEVGETPNNLMPPPKQLEQALLSLVNDKQGFFQTEAKKALSAMKPNGRAWKDVDDISNIPKSDPNWTPGNNRPPAAATNRDKSSAITQHDIIRDSKLEFSKRIPPATRKHRINPGVINDIAGTSTGTEYDSIDDDDDETYVPPASQKNAERILQQAKNHRDAVAKLKFPSPVKVTAAAVNDSSTHSRSSDDILDETNDDTNNQDDEFWINMPDEVQASDMAPKYSAEYLNQVFESERMFVPFVDPENAKILTDRHLLENLHSGLNEFVSLCMAKFKVFSHQLAVANRRSVRELHFQTLDTDNFMLAEKIIFTYLVPYEFYSWTQLQIMGEILNCEWVMLLYTKVISQSIRGFNIHEVVRQLCELLFSDELLTRINFAFSKPEREISVSRFKYKLFLRENHKFMTLLYREYIDQLFFKIY